MMARSLKRNFKFGVSSEIQTTTKTHPSRERKEKKSRKDASESDLLCFLVDTILDSKSFVNWLLSSKMIDSPFVTGVQSRRPQSVAVQFPRVSC